MAFASLRHPDLKISPCTGRCELRGRAVSRSAFSHHHITPRLSPVRDGSRDSQLVRDAAKLFVIIKAVAATKLYQASTMRAVATSTAMLTQAVAPHAPDAPPHDLTTMAANSDTATQTSLSPEPQPVKILHPQQITLNDTLLEAALWTDELQDMQARRKQLQADLEELTQHLRLTLQPTPTNRPTTTLAAASSSSKTTNPAVTSSQAEEYFVSFGPEFCGLTCKVEADAEIEQLRSALRQQIHTLSSHLLARASASPQPLQVMQMQFMDRVLDPMPVAKPSPSQAQVKKLQKQWNAAALDVTHLLVRIAQMQQLPAVPKARVTVAHVKEQVINHLHDRRAYLAQDDDI